MAFKVTARTVLQLGAELVSSDAVAFYELIKNAFDAKSPDVVIDVNTCIHWDKCLIFSEYIQFQIASENSDKPLDNDDFKSLKGEIAASVDPQSPIAKHIKDSINNALKWRDLFDALAESSCITISDRGEGMSLDELDTCFLTIGTRSRQKLRAAETAGAQRPVLGEKGLGRLSAMRLGSRLTVRTSKREEAYWNILDINWNAFSHDSDELLQDIDISPKRGPIKDSIHASGTTLAITCLAATWDAEKLTAIAKDQFTRLTDPFTPAARYPIKLQFNGARVPIPSLDRILFTAAHAKGTASFAIKDGNPVFAGEIDYLLHHRKQSFRLENEHLLGPSKVPALSVLKRLGPFNVEFYWFNRRILAELDGIGTRQKVLDLQRQWAGGLMVFRDGFRVHPYGDPDDDWIYLDRKALSAQGYKVNRRQIVGKVDIGARSNSALLDQTSREGLRDCPEKTALVNLLKHLLETQFRVFLNKVDEEIDATEPLNPEDIRGRVKAEVQRMRFSLTELKKKYPEAAEQSGVVRSVEDSVERLKELLAAVEHEVESYKKGRSELVHLAGMGLIVEIVVHELTRATDHALRTVAEANSQGLTGDAQSTLKTLEFQLRTLQKRLSVLDPASTSRRQHKERFDLVELVQDVLGGHNEQFNRHGVQCELSVVPKNILSWEVQMVKGMFVHVIENLLSNSFYWFKQRKKIDPMFSPKIKLVLDKRRKRLIIADNGPGIPENMQDKVFEAFYTTKPPGEGKGLGLFIAREIAKYHGAELQVSQCDEGTSLSGAVFNLVFGGQADGNG